jgi:hypothetical protein
MEEDGPRLAKLKLVYKKAVQEILKEEQRMSEILGGPGTVEKDSFFASTSKTNDSSGADGDLIGADGKGSLGEVLKEFKEKLSELFRRRLASMGLENKLNMLDRHISSNRISLRDVCSEEYIREIFESHIVEDKLRYTEAIEDAKRSSGDRIEELRSELTAAADELSALREENERLEMSYSELLLNFQRVVNK